MRGDSRTLRASSYSYLNSVSNFENDSNWKYWTWDYFYARHNLDFAYFDTYEPYLYNFKCTYPHWGYFRIAINAPCGCCMLVALHFGLRVYDDIVRTFFCVRTYVHIILAALGLYQSMLFSMFCLPSRLLWAVYLKLFGARSIRTIRSVLALCERCVCFASLKLPGLEQGILPVFVQPVGFSTSHDQWDNGLCQWIYHRVCQYRQCGCGEFWWGRPLVYQISNG